MERIIRSANADDAEAIGGIYAPYVTGKATSFEIDPPDAVEMARRIADLQPQYPWLVFEADREVLGYAYASPHHARQAYQWSVDVSVYIDARAHNRGVGRALYTSLFAVLREQGYVNAYAGITLPNPSSVGLHRAMRFLPVGVYSRVGYKFGVWHDVEWLQLRLAEPATPVPILVSAGELLQDGRMTAEFRRQAQTVKRF